MPMHVRFTAASGGSYGISVERLIDGNFFDFSNNTFVVSPVTQITALAAGTGNFVGLYKVDLASTPAAQFSDGQYSVYVHNTASANLCVLAAGSTFINGDTVPLSLTNITGAVLNAVASSYNAAGSIGQKINGAGSAGNPWTTDVSTGYTGTQAGAIQDLIYTVLNGVTFPANFNNLAITAGTGKVTVGTNSDKTGYALTAGEHTNITGDVLSATASSYNSAGTIGAKINSAGSAASPWTTDISTGYTGTQAGAILYNSLNGVTFPANFNSLAITAGTGKVTVGTNSDKSGYTLTQAFPTNFAALTIDAGTGGVTVKTNNDKTAYALTQAFPANFAAMTITAGTGYVTAGTNNDKTGYALTSGEHTNIAADVLGATASSYNAAGTIGQKVNASGSASNPWTTDVSTGYTGTQAGSILFNSLNGVTFPTNFSALAITAGTGKVTMGTNSDKTGYALTQTFPANFNNLAIAAGTGLVTVGTNNDKTGYALTSTEHLNIAGDVLGAVASSYNSAGTIGQKVNASGSASNPWTTDISTGYAGTQAGAILFNSLNGVVFPPRFGSLALDTSGRMLLQPSGLDAVVVEAGLNARQSLSIISAALVGTGSFGSTVSVAGAGVGTIRISGTTDSVGDRLTVRLSPPA